MENKLMKEMFPASKMSYSLRVSKLSTKIKCIIAKSMLVEYGLNNEACMLR